MGCVCKCILCPAGYYTHVSTLADVQENVMEYLHVLSRPMVINHDHDIIWTEAYMDTVVSLLLLLLVCLLCNSHYYLALKLSVMCNQNVRLIKDACAVHISILFWIGNRDKLFCSLSVSLYENI